jgi:hypothetical protein
MTIVTLDPDAFRTWLLAQSEDAVVGIAGTAGRCPLACFLNAQGGCFDPLCNPQAGGAGYMVGGGEYAFYDGSSAPLKKAPLPAWADWFLVLIDVQHGYGEPVARCVALGVLDRALAAVGKGGQ